MVVMTTVAADTVPRLFLPPDEVITFAYDPTIARSRLAKINVLFEQSKNVRINLFDDARYMGVIDSTYQDDLGTVWLGHFSGVEYSYFTIMKVGILYIGNFGSPAGVYEVSNVKGNLYRIIQIEENYHATTND